MFQKINKNFIFLAISIFVALIASIPLFHSGFFPIHDNEQIGRLFELDQALKAGQFPVRIIQDLGFGYGYLLFNFYPPLVYYLGEICKLLSISYIDSIKIVMGLGFVMSAISMYIFVKELFGKTAGIVSSTFYIFAPYHSVDLYVRGALPEFFSFVFIPAIFYSYLKLYRENSKKYVVMAALFNFLLVITHNLVALMASLFIGLYVLLLIYQSVNKNKFLVNVLLSVVFSLLLSAFFIIPALLENKYTMVSLLTKELADYSSHFVYIRQFWNSAWGYGGSIYGLSDGLSFQIGRLHIIAVALSFFLSLFLTFRKKFNTSVYIFILMFLISVFMQTFYSKFIWDHFQPLTYVQFPWRYLLFSVFFSSVLIGFVVSSVKNVRWNMVLSIALIASVIGLNINYFKPQKYISATDKDYISQSVLRWDTSKMSFEYVPKGISLKKSLVGNSIVNIDESQISKSVFTAKPENMNIKVLLDKPQDKALEVNVLKPGSLILNEFAYPGFTIVANGEKVSFNDNNKLKLISIELNPGSYIIEAKFEDTFVRKISNLLSLLGIVLLISYFYSGLFRKYAKN